MDLTSTTIDLFIGGYPGPSYQLTWEPPNLVYRAWSRGSEEPEIENLLPSEIEWQTFWAALDAIGVWTWKSKYTPPGLVCDGTGWEVTICCRNLAIDSDGDNAYPKGFKKFCQAVSRLVGGRAFA